MDKRRVYYNVFYIVQGDDGEDLSHPNLYRIKGSADPNFRLRHREILKHFPLRGRGHFHFRYRRSFKGGYVWVDVSEQCAVAPKYNGNYFMQVLRLERLAVDYGDGDAKYADNAVTRNGGSFTATTTMEAKNGFSYTDSDEDVNGVEEEDDYENMLRDQERKSSGRLKHRESSSRLLDFRTSERDTSRKRDEYDDDDDDDEEEEDLGDLMNPKYSSTSATLGNLASLEDLQSAFSNVGDGDAGGVGNLGSTSGSDELIVSIKKDIKNTKDAKDKVTDARLSMREKIEKWSTDNGGHLKNVRTLLCTLHTILYERGLGRWKEIGMADVLTSKDVEKTFKKAMRALHTDRLPDDATPDEIANVESLYVAVHKAMKTFRNKEGKK